MFAEQLPDQEHAGIFTQIDSGRCKNEGQDISLEGFYLLGGILGRSVGERWELEGMRSVFPERYAM